MDKEKRNISHQSQISSEEDVRQFSASSSTEENQSEVSILKDGEIDLIALVKTFWAGRKTILYSVGVCVCISLLIIVFSPVKYTASAMLLPSSENKSSSIGSLGALAGMAGINLGSMLGQSEGIPIAIYPQIVNSYPFLNEFIHEKFHFEDYERPVSIYDYVGADTIPSFGSKIAKYTIMLPWTLKNAIFSDKDELNELDVQDYGVLNIDAEEMAALRSMMDVFKIEIDKETDLVYISVEVEEPVLAAQYVQKALELLQKYIIEYKTRQVRENLDFVQDRYDEKKLEYEQIQMAFFEYKDTHRNIISERIDPELQRLSDAYDIATTVYKGLAQQLEQAKIAVKEETPVFTVLEPAKVPDKKSSPKIMLTLIIWIFMGGLGGMLIILYRAIVKNTNN